MRPVPPGLPCSDSALDGTRETGACAAPSTLPGTATIINSSTRYFAARCRSLLPPSPPCISAVLLVEDESHPEQDRDGGRRGSRKRDGQDAGNAQCLCHVAEKIDPKPGERAVEHHAGHAAQSREPERKTGCHEHHRGEHRGKHKQRIEIDFIARGGKSGLPRGLDEAGKIPERHRFWRREALLNARRGERGRQLVCRMTDRAALQPAHPRILEYP